MNASDYITHEEIRARAYDLWERLGRPAGRADEHWLAAERELQRERDALGEAGAAKAAPAAPAARPPRSRAAAR